MDFHGAKLALFLGDRLLVIRRDDFPGLPWPGHLDFPGGGREGAESPEDCALRETFEEVGLRLGPGDLTGGRVHRGTGRPTWFFVAHLPAEAEARIRFGDEGQGWHLMPPADYLAHPLRIPHLALLLAEVLTG